MKIIQLNTFSNSTPLGSDRGQKCSFGSRFHFENDRFERMAKNTCSSFADKFMAKLLPKKKLEKDILAILNLRNQNSPVDFISTDFINDKEFKALSENQLKYFKNLIYFPNTDRQIDLNSVFELVVQDGKKSAQNSSIPFVIENIKKYKLLDNIEGRKNQLRGDEIISLAKEQPEVIEKIINSGLLKDFEGRHYQLSMYSILKLADLIFGNEQGEKLFLKNIKDRNLLSNNFGADLDLGASKIYSLSKLNESAFKQISEIGILKYHQYFEDSAFEALINLVSPDDIMKYEKLLKGFSNSSLQIKEEDMSLVQSLDDVQIARAIKITNSFKNLRSFGEINHLARLDEDIFEKFEKAKSDAILKKMQLKNAEDDMSDESIKKFFNNNTLSICDTIYTVGLPAFEYAYASKLEGLRRLVDLNYSNFDDKFQPVLKKLLDDKSISPEERLDKFKILAMLPQEKREILYPYIKPHNVTSQNVADAKKIWAQRGKTFDEKYSEFCEKFDIFPDDYKIKNSIEKLANVNHKGYKILYDIGEENLREVVKKQNINNFNKVVNKMIFENIGVEYDEVTAKKLNLAKSKYLGTIFSGSEDFKENFKELIEVIKEEPNKSLKEIFDELPQNIVTKNDFEDLGINYDGWCNSDKSCSVKIKIKTDTEKARFAALKNLENELSDDAFKILPKNETDKIFEALKKEGFFYKPVNEPVYDSDGYLIGMSDVYHLFKGEENISFDDLKSVISIIKNEISKNDFWFVKDPNSKEINQAKETVCNHILKLRDAEIKNALTNKDYSETTVEVSKTDMNDISHSLFLGNQAGCCMAVGTPHGNDYAAPRYILDKFIQAIEVRDGKDFVGNTICYIAKVDGTPSLVLDNIELNVKYQYNDNIRDAMFECAKNICSQIGKPDMPIYAGPYRHKVNLSSFNCKPRFINIVGDTNGKDTYIDYIGETIVDGFSSSTTNLFKIR